MFNNFIQDNLEGYEPSFIPGEMPNFMMPGFDNYNTELFQRDFQNFPLLATDLEGLDTTFMQMFDLAFQNLPEEVKQWIPNPYDCSMLNPEEIEQPIIKIPKKPVMNYSNNKIGTISVEERRIKVEKFLEKRKRRNFKKKISYMCRKKVADQRVRVKGRFVSKTQADALLEFKSSE